jgi:glycerophosphoryl diester phosphodiesterase
MIVDRGARDSFKFERRPGACLAAVVVVAGLLSAATAHAAGTPLQDNLLAAWTFNEGTGNSIFDAAPTGAFGDIGSLRNAPTWTTGKFGSALQFNGVDQDVLIPNSADMNIGTNSVTMSAWVKLDQLPSAISGAYSGIMDSAPDNFVLYLDKANNELRFKVTTASGAAARPGIPASLLDTTNWHHIMGVYDGAASEASIYLDGQLTSTLAAGGLTGNVRSGQVAGIGSQVAATSPFAASSLFKGSIDDFGIWNRALGLGEAQYLYNNGVGHPLLAANPIIEPVVPPMPHNPSIDVEGHRGNSVAAPENTLSSARAAAGYADFVEFDVYTTADNKIVVMHDSTLDRTTNGSGSIASRNYTGYIDGLDAGSWFSPAFAGEKVPLMSEMVETIRANGMQPFLERKAGPAGPIVDELNSLGALHDTVIIAFDWNFLSDVRALDAEVKLGALGSGAINASVIANVLASGANFLDWSDSGSITQAVVDQVHNAGLELHIWTVDNQARMQQLIDLGVDGVTTNSPQTLRSIVPIAGDFNYDGQVDAADFVIWRKTMGDAASYGAWSKTFGRVVGGAASGSGFAETAVPEPTALGLMLCCAAICALSFRKMNACQGCGAGATLGPRALDELPTPTGLNP